MTDWEQFRLDRIKDMGTVSDRLLEPVQNALDEGLVGEELAAALLGPIEAAFTDEYRGVGEFDLFPTPAAAFRWAWERIKPGLDAAKDTASAKRIADWLGTAIVNAARVATGDEARGKMWLSRRDDRVRAMHVEADGQIVGYNDKFTVGGFELAFPGEPVGPPEVWINCRCVVAREAVGEFDDEMIETFGQHDLIWYEGRRTPEVVAKGAKGKKGGAGTKAGKVVKRRPATAEEEKRMRGGKWLRVNRDGKKPGDPGYMERKSKVRPQNNAGETDDLAVWWDEDIDGEEIPMSVATDEDVMEEQVVDDTLDDEEFASVGAVPWYGVLAPEGAWSGDKRRFAEGALEWRDLPVPLLWQEKSGMGHEGSVVVGQIADIWKKDGLVWGAGTFAATEDSDKVIGLIADEHLRGVSIDVDAAEMALEDDEQSMTFSKGRISAATVVPIPAFAEAFIRLGTIERPEEMAASAGPGTVGADDVPLPFREYDAEARKRMAKDGHALPDGSFPIADEEDLRNAIQAIGRAGDPDAAKAHIKKRARALGKADLIPEGWSEDAVAASAAEFKRGPGWVTDPVPTKRIHDYWTKPGEEGYAKIKWGTPGDFRRLRAALAKYVSPRFLNRTAAEWHHDALGYWPGEKGKPGNPMAGDLAPALHLVASGGWCAPSQWFSDPSLTGPTAVTVTEEGQIYGHLATWGTCHIGFPGTCTTAPHSPSDYAYYMTGAVRTDEGEVLAVGQITMDTGHAPLQAGARAAAAHYDNTGSVVADVRAGDDEFGIWVAGAVRPEATEAQRRALMAGALSGDWRAIAGSLELVAALVVNVPGFPIPRTGMAASGDMQTALVAAGIPTVGTEKDVEAAVADLVKAVADEVEGRASRRARAASLLSNTREMRVNALLTSMEV